MFNLIPDADDRLPACPECFTHPMWPHGEKWRCTECGELLEPGLLDPVWPWETYEEGHARWLKRLFG